MSIISKAVSIAAKKAAEGSAGDVALSALNKAGKAIDNRIEKKKEKEEKKLASLKAANPLFVRLLLVQERGKFKESYVVYDDANQVKYIIKGERLSKKASFTYL